MSDKSYVSMEQNVCEVCGKTYDTGSILMDTRIVNGKLRESMEHYTVTGWGLCPEHRGLKDQGYIALVEAENPKHGGTLKREDAYRTGRLAHVKREVFPHIFGAEAPDFNMVFVEPGVIEILENAQKGADNGQEETDSGNSDL